MNISPRSSRDIFSNKSAHFGLASRFISVSYRLSFVRWHIFFCSNSTMSCFRYTMRPTRFRNFGPTPVLRHFCKVLRFNPTFQPAHFRLYIRLWIILLSWFVLFGRVLICLYTKICIKNTACATHAFAKTVYVLFLCIFLCAQICDN